MPNEIENKQYCINGFNTFIARKSRMPFSKQCCDLRVRKDKTAVKYFYGDFIAMFAKTRPFTSNRQVPRAIHPMIAKSRICTHGIAQSRWKGKPTRRIRDINPSHIDTSLRMTNHYLIHLPSSKGIVTK